MYSGILLVQSCIIRFWHNNGSFLIPSWRLIEAMSFDLANTIAVEAKRQLASPKICYKLQFDKPRTASQVRVRYLQSPVHCSSSHSHSQQVWTNSTMLAVPYRLNQLKPLYHDTVGLYEMGSHVAYPVTEKHMALLQVQSWVTKQQPAFMTNRKICFWALKLERCGTVDLR